MFYFEGIIYIEKTFFLEKVYSNLRIINEGVYDILIYQGTNLIARVKPNENLTFRCFKAENLTLKADVGSSSWVRLWLW